MGRLVGAVLNFVPGWHVTVVVRPWIRLICHLCVSQDTLVEQLRCRSAKPMSSARVGSNPIGVGNSVLRWRHFKRRRVVRIAVCTFGVRAGLECNFNVTCRTALCSLGWAALRPEGHECLLACGHWATS